MKKSKILKKTIDSIPRYKIIQIRKQAKIAIQLKELIDQDKNLTQKRICELTGMKESFISRVIAGRTNLTLSTIARFEAVLGKQLVVIPKYFQIQEIKIDKSVNIFVSGTYKGKDIPLKDKTSRENVFQLIGNFKNVSNTTNVARA